MRAQLVYTLPTPSEYHDVNFVLRHDFGFSTHGLRLSWVVLCLHEYAH